MKLYHSVLAGSAAAFVPYHATEAWIAGKAGRAGRSVERGQSLTSAILFDYRCGSHISTTGSRLFSSSALRSAVSEEEEVASVAVGHPTTTGLDGTSSSANFGKVLADGRILSTFPGGLTAIQIDEETSDNDHIDADVDLKLGFKLSANLLNNKLKNNSGSSVSGDLLGKQIVFSDGATGVVVAHRPPIAFVYSDSDSSSSSSAAARDNTVKVYSSLATVHVSPDCLLVDCFGRPIHSQSIDDSGVASKESLRPAQPEPKQRAIFAPIPAVAHIALINHPMLTGITMLDVLTPIGRGQNMLMVSHDIPLMQNYVHDFIKTQINSNNNGKIKCIYASTTEAADVVLQRFQKAGIAATTENLQVVAPTTKSSSSNQDNKDGKDQVSRAAEAVTIAATACAMAETYALEQGMHTLVIVDTLDMHKLFWDATTRVLVNVFGVDAVVQGDLNGSASSEMRAFYSSLIQRAGQYNEKKGGGTVTLILLKSIPPPPSTTASSDDDETVYQVSDFEQPAGTTSGAASKKMLERIQMLVQRNIPLTATNLRKINIPIPSKAEGERRFALQHVDDLNSMTDGIIWLDDADAKTKNVGTGGVGTLRQQPPLDPQRSVTRIGIGADTQSRADAPALQRVAEGLRLAMSQAIDMQAAEITPATRKQIQRSQALLLAMYQEPGSGGRRLSESCAALLAAQCGFLDTAVADNKHGGPTATGGITKEGVELIKALLQHVRTEAADVLAQVDHDLDMSEEALAKLKEAVASFFA